MPINTLATLTAAVQSWSTRTDADTIGKIPDFVTLAETRMGADIGGHLLEQTVEVPIADAVAEIPANVLEVRALRIVGATHPDVEVTSRERIQHLRANFYRPERALACFVGQTIELFPDETGTLEIVAKCAVPPLTAESVNWILTRFPSAYLFGALLELALYLEDDAAATRWGIRYAEAIAQINTSGGYRGGNARSVPRNVR